MTPKFRQFVCKRPLIRGRTDIIPSQTLDLHATVVIIS